MNSASSSSQKYYAQCHINHRCVSAARLADAASKKDRIVKYLVENACYLSFITQAKINALLSSDYDSIYLRDWSRSAMTTEWIFVPIDSFTDMVVATNLNNFNDFHLFVVYNCCLPSYSFIESNSNESARCLDTIYVHNPFGGNCFFPLYTITDAINHHIFNFIQTQMVEFGMKEIVIVKENGESKRHSLPSPTQRQFFLKNEVLFGDGLPLDFFKRFQQLKQFRITNAAQIDAGVVGSDHSFEYVLDLTKHLQSLPNLAGSLLHHTLPTLIPTVTTYRVDVNWFTTNDYHQYIEDTVIPRWNGWSLLWFLEYCEQNDADLPHLKLVLNFRIMDPDSFELANISFLQCFQRQDKLAVFFTNVGSGVNAIDAYFPLFEQHKRQLIQQIFTGHLPELPSEPDSVLVRFLREKYNLFINNQKQQQYATTKIKLAASGLSRQLIDESITNSPIDHNLKFLFKGDSGVGKTCFLYHMVNKEFCGLDTKSTIGVDFKSAYWNYLNHRVCIRLWDTPGQETYAAIATAHFKEAFITYVVYDVSKRSTFDNVSQWIGDCRRYGNQLSIVILIGNKCDLIKRREIAFEEGLQFAKENNCLFFEVSALTGENIDLCFEYAVFWALIHLEINRQNESNLPVSQKGNDSVTSSSSRSLLEAKNKKKCIIS